MTSHVRLIVEGESDKDIVFALLVRARLPLEHLQILSAGGVSGSMATCRTSNVFHAALVDRDINNKGLAEAREAVSLAWGVQRVFFAEPNIEAWLTPDEATARELGDFETRLPTFDERKPMLRREDFGILTILASCLKLDRAAARIPSLREFLLGMAELLGGDPTPWGWESAGRTFSRDIIAGLVREIPPDEIAWRTSDGTSFTSRQLVEEIEVGTELGRQYASDILRVSRDLLRRKAKRSP